MSRKALSVPTYRLHKSSGQARVVLRLPGGARRSCYLGKYGSPESRAAYSRIVAELAVSPVAPTAIAMNPSATLDAVLLAFWKWAQAHYRLPNGTASSELANVLATIEALRDGFGSKPAGEFGPLALKAVRGRMVERGWSRGVINRRVSLAKRAFRWAASEQIIPIAIYQSLASVSGLQRGRTEARELPPVGPVSDVVVDATLKHLGRHVRGLVEFQWFTGCRPGEACALRRCDIDTSGAVWLYRPPVHKNTWRGKSRTIPIGPKAQAVLREFLTPDMSAYLFSPRRAVEEHRAARASNRVTPRYTSHTTRSVTKRKLDCHLSESYNRSSYALAVDRACDRAFPLPEAIAPQWGESRKKWWARLIAEERAEVNAWRKSHRWSPNQLRHSFATRVRKSHGLESVQVLLGHTHADITEIYAERDEQLATTVAAAIG